ncbi:MULTISPECIES: cytochrome c oxidase assembly protein [unclassified Mycobacterium]|uniref:cytochrome c oxidase assembly protein n=1 Tax=unclassified Mycobacterium TaxID=2642494 RepID=UPI0029C7490D|nr:MULTISPECIES: cytochrome c oxidase assembly protein [unclassified Mycobacterium]
MGTAPPSGAAVLTNWTSAPVADLLVALVLTGYLLLLVRLRRTGRRWPIRRTVSAIAAAAILVLVVNSPLAIYSHHLFWVHMIVHLLLITVAPALLVWAQPIRLLHNAADPGTRLRLDSFRRSRPFHWLITPRFTVPLYASVLVLTHLTGFQQAMSQHMWIHDSELALYLITGYLLLLPLVGEELTTDPPMAPFLSFVIIAFCMGPDTLVGVVLMMTRTALAPAYAGSRNWGPSALVDQSMAGAIMWFAGDGLMMILMVIIGGRWIAHRNDSGASLGPWLDRIRRQTTLDADADADSSIDLDDDDAALAAYNARLAALHGRQPKNPS